MYVDENGNMPKWLKGLCVFGGAVLTIAAIAAITVVTGGTATPLLVGAAVGAGISACVSATGQLLSTGTLSPIVKDYIYDIVPKPCRHFCGRETDLENIHELLKENDKIFLTGVAGIGKSELAKMYAEKYKNEYIN